MNYAIVLSGGVGTRLGLDIPKQYYEVNQKPIIGYVIDTMASCDFIDGIVIVAAKEWRDYMVQHVNCDDKFLGFAEPGMNRQLSIYNGLCYLKDVLTDSSVCTMKTDEADAGKLAYTSEFSNWNDVIVLIQDAARPNTSVELYRKCFSLEGEEDGAMPVLPMKDTVYMSADGVQVSSLLDRNTIFAGQAPESFRFGKYLEANERLLPERIMHINGSTEPAIMAGMHIRMIEGDEHNFKITTESDLERFCREVVQI